MNLSMANFKHIPGGLATLLLSLKQFWKDWIFVLLMVGIHLFFSDEIVLIPIMVAVYAMVLIVITLLRKAFLFTFWQERIIAYVLVFPLSLFVLPGRHVSALAIGAIVTALLIFLSEYREDPEETDG